MQTTRINITLPKGLAVNLRRTIPVRFRSQFIAKALEDKLDQKYHSKTTWPKSLKANQAFYQKIAQEWEATETEGWAS